MFAWFGWPVERRRKWDRIDDRIVLGVAPIFQSDVDCMARELGVRYAVNLCKEWNPERLRKAYAAYSITQLWLPTIDFDPPSYTDCVKGAAFIDQCISEGKHSVYIHCKAGRGRSTTILLAYLIKYRGMSPVEADSFIRSKRPHISDKINTAPIQRLWAEQREVR